MQNDREYGYLIERLNASGSEKKDGYYPRIMEEIYDWEREEVEDYMSFHGSITFYIADERNLDVDFGVDIIPTKTVKKGDVIVRERKAPANIWMYELKFDNEEEYYSNLERMINQLCERSEYVNQLTKIYEEVSIRIFIGSDFAQIGFYLPNRILKKIALLDCEVSIEIISFGMVED